MTETKKSTFGLDKNVASVLCYLGLWVTGLVFYLSEKEDKDIRFNAMQSILTFGGLTVAYTFLSVIPYIGTSLSGLISLFTFILWLICLVKSYQETRFKLPIVGDLAEKQAK